jgi:hypothetical protein
VEWLLTWYSLSHVVGVSNWFDEDIVCGVRIKIDHRHLMARAIWASPFIDLEHKNNILTKLNSKDKSDRYMQTERFC